ncbi:dihydrofolate reductase family protein [Streptomyces sp. NPDC054842]
MMRKLHVGSLVSLDGVYGDPRAWASEYFDDEAAELSLRKLLDCEAMLMGRHTYEYFAPAWSAQTGPYPDRLNAMPKFVFSSKLTTAEWNNTAIVPGDPVRAVEEMKRQDGADLVIYGFGQLARTLLEHDLVDELDFWIHPVVLGDGAPLLRPGQLRRLRLVSARPRATGVVSLRYAGNRDTGDDRPAR